MLNLKTQLVINKKFIFPKKEHLCGEIRIGKLFVEGTAFIVYPLRVVYRISDETDVPVRVMVAAPKKRFKSAVKRNRLKRLMRESYRLNKSILIDKCIEKNINIQIAFNYVADVELDFKTIQAKMRSALTKISESVENLTSKSK